VPDLDRGSRDVLTRPAPPPDTTIRYGPTRDQVIDIRLPAAQQARPLVIVIHGGFWRAEWDRAHAGPLSAALAQAGYVVATIEYRRTGQVDTGWPATFDDVSGATAVMPAVLEETMRGRVDLDRTVVVGHSAGGHLALWLAGRVAMPAESGWQPHESPPWRGVVSLAGVADLAAADDLHLDDDAARALMGGSRGEVPERFAVADPSRLLPSGVRVRLLHGTADTAVPIEQSRTYARRAAGAGDDVRLDELDGVGHFELIDPVSAAWPRVLATIAELAG
jgi:acetyl esterase/lipase